MRTKRKLQDNAVYHVIARSNRQEFILEHDDIKELFLVILIAAKKKYKFKLINFSIMSNHVHIMIKPQKIEDLSKIMQWILSVFAVRFNKIHGYHGHVWYDRFKSLIAETFKHFAAIYEYINNNSVKAGLSEKAEDYRYCGLFFRKKKAGIIDPAEMLFG